MVVVVVQQQPSAALGLDEVKAEGAVGQAVSGARQRVEAQGMAVEGVQAMVGTPVVPPVDQV